jgi:hypothetical protein
MPAKYKTICLQEPEFVKLSQAKALYEADTNEKADWGKFLLILAIAYLISKGLQQQSQQERR